MPVFSVGPLDPRPRRHSETYARYLGRSSHRIAGAIREVLDAWLSDYPVTARDELVRRLRCGDDTHFLSAFFELYLQALLSRLGYSIEIHPPTAQSSKTPDFLLHGPQGERTYLEAVLATETSAAERSAQARIDVLFDLLDDLESPAFFLDMKHRGQLRSAPPTSRLRRDLRAWLATLDPDDCLERSQRSGFSALPEFDWEHDGLRVKFQAHPKSARLRGQPDIRTLGAQSSGLHRVEPAAALRGAVKTKSSRYRELGCPFVVAVNMLQPYADRQSIAEALFGTEQTIVTPGPRGGERIDHGRADDGVFISAKGAARNTRLSALLVAVCLHPTTVASSDSRVCLYHHPGARYPYAGPLCRLPQVRAETGELHELPGARPHELLGIDPGRV